MSRSSLFTLPEGYATETVGMDYPLGTHPNSRVIPAGHTILFGGAKKGPQVNNMNGIEGDERPTYDNVLGVRTVASWKGELSPWTLMCMAADDAASRRAETEGERIARRKIVTRGFRQND